MVHKSRQGRMTSRRNRCAQRTSCCITETAFGDRSYLPPKEGIKTMISINTNPAASNAAFNLNKKQPDAPSELEASF